MSTSGSGRLKLFLLIFAVIVLVHVIVIALTVPSSGPSETADVKTAEQPENGNTGNSGVSSPVRKDQASEKRTRTPGKAPETKFRYRKVSEEKNFGKPFSFIYARRGKLPATMVPGDDSRTAILVDMNSRRVLWEKDSRTPVPVASMSKMMTVLLTMEHLEKNPALSLNSQVRISRDVLKLPSREGIVWLDPRETFPVSDLVKCATIKSANDAALQLALTVAGSEKKFVAMMNRRAVQLGMKNTKFINAHGLPDKQRNQSLASAHDMVRLGERLLEYPYVMTCFKTLSTSIREGEKKTVIANTNKLVRKNYADAEGMKTGYTRKAGFCLTFSVKRNGRRLMGCVTGFKTARERDLFCKNLIDWAFAGCPEKKQIRRKQVKKIKQKAKGNRGNDVKKVSA